jgi:hypothetical protein
MSLSYNYLKAILNNAVYTLTTNGRTLFGQVVGYANDHRGFGAVVKFPNGTKFFYAVGANGSTLVNLGQPPQRRKSRKVARAYMPGFRLR